MRSRGAEAVHWIWSCVFFSSRRRHTRYWRDWSSDVCSSDLEVEPAEEPGGHRQHRHHAAGDGRSEERRVGKECRSRRSSYHYKKKTRDRMTNELKATGQSEIVVHSSHHNGAETAQAVAERRT